MKKQFFLIAAVAVLFFASCFKKNDYDHVKAADLISFQSKSQTVLADGNSAALIKVVISKGAIPSRRTVTFKTSTGSFTGGKGDSLVINADDNFAATAMLVNTRSGSAVVSAKINGYSLTSADTIEFKRAYPVKITAKVDSFAVGTSYHKEILITATMKSDNGIPSQGQPVTFSAITDGGQPVGMFLNGINVATSDATGTATIRFSAGETNLTGRVSLIAETLKDDNTPIRSATYVYLTH